MVEENSLLMDVQEEYVYVVEGREGTITLPVDEADVILNADGELDCPFDTVLRKNRHTFEDLNNWNAKEIRFIRVKNKVEEILRRIEMNVNL